MGLATLEVKIQLHLKGRTTYRDDFVDKVIH